MLTVIAGHDSKDPNTANIPVPAQYRVDQGLNGLRLGLIRDYSLSGLQEDVAAAMTAALSTLEDAGATIVEVELLDVEYATSALMTIDIAEPAAYHAEWLRARPEDYGSDVRTFLEQGEMYTATQYIQAQRYRSMLHGQFVDVLREVDVMVTPTVPYVAPVIGERSVTIGSESVSLIDAIMRYNALPPLVGVPAVSLPCGFSRDGLPIGMQLIGRAFDEAGVLGVGYSYQELTDWHRRKPQLSEVSV
jgi:aspartyl-tRNA(Asn)/glutamyl-tRNA(Gln) amidotransferase subunit A